jgi:hypothetical protein
MKTGSQMTVLTKEQCKQVSGGSGYISSSGRTETTTSSSSTGRSGYISASG